MLKILTIGLLLGVLGAPLLWFGGAQLTAAQSLPFTPTPEPTDLPTATATALPPTTTPTATDVPPTAQPIVIVATPTELPATALPTATALPPGYGRDACDPNHQLTYPCALPTESDIPNLSFVDDPVDVFSFLLKGGRQYRIAATVDKAGGIDPTLDVFVAGQTNQPIATNDDARIGDPSAVVTVTVDADGWFLARVTNRAPGDVRGKTYTMSARSVGPAASSGTPAATNPDDLIGNAYDAQHAVRLAWDVPYDLSMRCPDPRPNACYAGRHTFLLVPVKNGVPFTAITYDLGAGVDTTLALYRPDMNQTDSGPGQVPGWRIVATNDDVVAGWTLRSQLMLTPDWSGATLLVIGPSEREDMPPVPVDGRPGRYRLIVGSPGLTSIKAVMAAQNDMPPTPVPATPRPTGQAAPAAVSTASGQDQREVIKESCSTGQAVVGEKATTMFAAAPPGADDKIAAYPSGASVKLLGQCYRGWVKVQPADSVTPGWMWGANLRPDELGNAPTPTILAGDVMSGTVQAGTATPSANAGDTSPLSPLVTATTTLPATVGLTPLEPLPLPTEIAAVPASRAVTVEVCTAEGKTTTCGKPLAGLRVELLLAATRQILTANATDASGNVTLSVSVMEGSAVLLSIPALGLETPLAADATTVPIRVPAGAKP